MKSVFFKKSSALLIAVSLSLPVVADKDYLEVDSFEAIDVGTGMHAEVKCGSSNTVTLFATKKILDKLEVKVQGGVLEIERHTSASNILNNIFGSDDKSDKSVKISIETNGSLSTIEGSTGSFITVAACAVNSTMLKVDAGTGANINVSGTTTTLDLDLSTGSVFNKRATKFKVELAKVDLSTGSLASLCGATTITGDASTGAVIFASESAMTANVELSLGAQVKKKCR